MILTIHLDKGGRYVFFMILGEERNLNLGCFHALLSEQRAFTKTRDGHKTMSGNKSLLMVQSNIQTSDRQSIHFYRCFYLKHHIPYGRYGNTTGSENTENKSQSATESKCFSFTRLKCQPVAHLNYIYIYI